MEKAYSIDEALTKPNTTERLVLKYGKVQHEPIDSRISRLVNLKELYIEDFNLSNLSLPPEIINLKTLESISLQFSKELSQIPDIIFKIESLKRISTAGLRGITSISDEIRNLNALTNATLGFELKHIPKGLLSMKSVLGLDLCIGDIENPSAISENYGDGLINLGVLNLITKNLKDIPYQLFKSTKYNSISISCNDGSGELNFNYPKLENLTRLKLSNFKNLDSRIADLTNLKTLDVFGFKGDLIGLNFSNLKTLEFLELNNSYITQLPENIAGAINLRRIVLSNSRISYFPTELSNLNKLKGIDLQNCENLHFESLYDVVKLSTSINWIKMKRTNLNDSQKSRISKELKKNE
jgi:Leucine-rich repeat (LRR) protein